MNSKELQQTISVQPRADFEREDYKTLIEQKGRRILYEKALLCPCKSPSTNQQSGCKNCGGIGWIFVNPIQTRMIVSAVKIVTEFKPWSQEARCCCWRRRSRWNRHRRRWRCFCRCRRRRTGSPWGLSRS